MVVKYFYISECTSLSEWCGGAGGTRESCPSVSCGGCALINMARERERERRSGDSEQVREGTNTSVLVQFSLLPHNNTTTLQHSPHPLQQTLLPRWVLSSLCDRDLFVCF